MSSGAFTGKNGILPYRASKTDLRE